MTFDEAFKVIWDEKFGNDIKDETPRHSGDPEKFDFVISDDGIGTGIEKLVDLITQLKEEYAPTVEMTKRQYHSFKLWKYHTAGWNMTNCAEWARDEKMTATNAMQAWLHPETIKVVDD
ncbi:hypothetical protein ACUIJP_04490 [Leuconostoc pseudomesenteroides]|uniref:hypothetical protein n=1 Tax=Leuconostoc pseudomesenteroides TaxID=33968 RepID=UPI00403D6FC8